MGDLHTCTGKKAEKFTSWLLSVEKVDKLMDNDLKDTYIFCFSLS